MDFIGRGVEIVQRDIVPEGYFPGDIGKGGFFLGRPCPRGILSEGIGGGGTLSVWFCSRGL